MKRLGLVAALRGMLAGFRSGQKWYEPQQSSSYLFIKHRSQAKKRRIARQRGIY